MATLRWIPCLLMRSRGSHRSLHSKKRPGTQVNQAKTTGSLSNDDADGNENVNNAIRVKHASKKTLYISLLSLHDFDAKTSLFHVFGPRETTSFFLIFRNSIQSLRIQLQKYLPTLTNWTRWMEWARLSFKQCIFSFQVTFSFLLPSFILLKLPNRTTRTTAGSDLRSKPNWPMAEK